jgi:hypothetical protein
MDWWLPKMILHTEAWAEEGLACNALFLWDNIMADSNAIPQIELRVHKVCSLAYKQFSVAFLLRFLRVSSIIILYYTKYFWFRVDLDWIKRSVSAVHLDYFLIKPL